MNRYPGIFWLALLLGAPLQAHSGQSTVPVIAISNAEQQQNGSQSSELLLIIQQLQDEVRRLHGQIESQQFVIDQMRADQKARYRDLDRRMGVLLQHQAAPAEPVQESEPAEPKTSESTASQPSAPSSSGAAPGISDQQAYNAAFSTVRERDFSAALAQFTAFLQNYPDSPLVANAHYWLGEVHLAQEQHRLSEQAFLQVVNQYPQSPKAADALYKLGILYRQQGQKEKSRQYLQQVIRDYPDTSAARLAQSTLN